MPAGDRFVQVPTEVMRAFLEAKGFKYVTNRSSREVVYERAHHKDPRYKVLVYTSIAEGNVVARKLGKDAIRIVALFESSDGQAEGRKLPRVFRTGTVERVLERMYGRMREAYAKCNDAIARRVHAA